MNRPRRHAIRLDHEHIALVLQGGGALGAYQAGAYEEIERLCAVPTWVAGVSVGAINAALIAGNPAGRRVERLREFWDLVALDMGILAPLWAVRRIDFHRYSAAMAALCGVHGFYRPYLVPAMFQPAGSKAACGVYDTAPLRTTLERLVDFDLINSAKVRLSVGAVNIRTGNSTYFDNTKQRLGPEHIMASGALPPAFPPVTIEGEAYWDGGIFSNTPLQYVLDQRGSAKTLVAQIDLFNARGPLPVDLPAVMTRQKDIMYSSRTRFSTDQAAQIQRHKRAMASLIAKLPPKWKDDTDVRELAAMCRTGHIDIVHFIYREVRNELESKDYEFSRQALHAHWQAGRRDVQKTVAHPAWLMRSNSAEGVSVYDLAQDIDVT